MRSYLQFYALVLISFFVFAVAVAGIPPLITFQGRLTDDIGNPVPDDNYTITFAVFDDSLAGTKRWEETQTVAVAWGVFNAQLGTVTALDESLFGDHPNLFVAINLGGQPEMRPRTRLTASAFTFQALKAGTAATAQTVINDAIGSAQIANGSILLEDLGQNSAADGQVVKWQGGWTVADDGELSLPYAGTISHNQPAFKVENTGTGPAAQFGGKVGIGLSNPGAKLDVDGLIRVQGATWPVSGEGLEIGYNPTINKGYVLPYDRAGAVWGDLYLGNGKVGIGTSSPTSKLTVSGGSGSVDLLLVADTDNSGEEDQPSLTLSQDNGGVVGQLGYFNTTNDLSLINRHPTSNLHLGGGDTIGVTIMSNRNVAIGTTDPGTHRLKVLSTTSGYANATFLAQNDSPTGYAIYGLTASSTPTCLLQQDGSGQVLHCKSPAGTIFALENDGTVECNVLEILGGSDLAEPFEIHGTEQIVPGMVVCIDPERPGELRVAQESYDPTVAGIISGANGLSPGLTMRQNGTITEGSHPIALTGRVYCWADASTGAIQPGDFLTTSDHPGHAMKAADRERSYGSVIGKAMTGLQEGTGLVLVLVNLQ